MYVEREGVSVSFFASEPQVYPDSAKEALPLLAHNTQTERVQKSSRDLYAKFDLGGSPVAPLTDPRGPPQRRGSRKRRRKKKRRKRKRHLLVQSRDELIGQGEKNPANLAVTEEEEGEEGGGGERKEEEEKLSIGEKVSHLLLPLPHPPTLLGPVAKSPRATVSERMMMGSEGTLDRKRRRRSSRGTPPHLLGP